MVDLEALFKVTYALYLVTSFEGGKYNGLLGNSFCQVNSEPPTFLVIINKESYTHHMIEATGLFGVSELAQDAPFEFFGPFGFKSGKNTDKFAKINYKIAEKGVPVILDNAVAYFVCEVFKTIDMGSHTIFIGNCPNPFRSPIKNL